MVGWSSAFPACAAEMALPGGKPAYDPIVWIGVKPSKSGGPS